MLAMIFGDQGLQSHRILRLGKHSAFFLSGLESAVEFLRGGVEGQRSNFVLVGAVDMERRKLLGTTSGPSFRAWKRTVESILTMK